MNRSWIEDITGHKYVDHEVVQQLWGGYGELNRVYLSDGSSVVLKEIRFPKHLKHPRGWATVTSDERKRKSYEIELKWYETLARLLDEKTKVPTLLGVLKDESTSILLEDLNTLGYDRRYNSIDISGARNVLKWLARLHAKFLNVEPEGLWETGTYWHLATRPDEFEVMESSWLKGKASEIDEVLRSAKYQTIVHGDAKLANFCFGHNMDVAAVDFQYVGGGCGMKDVAYFISSCFSSDEAIKLESELLDCYFDELRKNIPDEITDELEEEWRNLYPVAWADFVRFLLGWAPDHYKLNEYSLLQVERTKQLITP
jgi:hypothetical protein